MKMNNKYNEHKRQERKMRYRLVMDKCDSTLGSLNRDKKNGNYLKKNGKYQVNH